MESVSYDDIGNLIEGYRLGARTVTPVGIVTDPSLVLKFYAMLKKEPFDWATVSDAKNFLRTEIKGGKIDPLSGLGFVILSEDTLNVARWDKEDPIVLKNQIYGYTYCLPQERERLGYKNIFDTAQLLDIREAGAFCIWELRIINYEITAWKIFLESERTEFDKKQYVRSTLKGRFY